MTAAHGIVGHATPAPRLALALPLLMLMLMPTGVLAAPKAVGEAVRHFERGEKLYVQGRFEAAIQEFLEANRLAPRTATVFNIVRLI
jgi:hypothetical protein